MSDTALVLLAAGESSRLGRPKAFLELGGVTFLDRILVSARAAGCRPLLATVREDDRWLRAGLPDDVEEVVNDDLDAGPLGGLRRAVERLADEPAVSGLLLWPVDAPRVPAALVRALILAGQGVDTAVPTHAGAAGHPAYFARSLFGPLLEPQVRTPREVQERDGVLRLQVPVPSPTVLDDVDTPEDYERLLAEEGES